jgi:PAS domain S-box-containing protein
VAVTSPEKGWVEVNEAACELLGYSREELAGLTWAELTHPDDLADDLREFDRILAGESDSYTLDKRFIRKDGSVLWTMLSLSCARRPDGSVDFFVCNLKDIGQRKRAEEALRASEARLARVLEGSSDGLWEIDVKTRRVALSARYCEIVGRPAQEAEVPLDELMTIIEPAFLAAIREDMAALRTGTKQRFEWEYRIRRPEGDLRWVQSRGKVAGRDADGVATRISGTITDIDARKRAEEALRESEARFRVLAGQTPVGIFQADARGRIAFVNQAFLAMTGLSESEALGPALETITHPEDRDRVLRAWRESVASGKGFASEYRHRLADGRVVWVRGFSAPIRDVAGAVTGFVGALVDLTEARLLQLQLAQASRQAALGTLVAGVAHEINNPLTGVISGTGAARELLPELRRHLQGSTPLDRAAVLALLDEADEALEDAHQGGQRVARIVKELRTFGAPDSTRARLRLADAADLALRLLPTASGSPPAVTIEDHGAPDVMGSFGQVAQVVVALLTNARKATPPGKPGTITVRIGPGTPGTGRLEVVDQGTGIAPPVLERIFDPFFTTSDVGQGMGLGLATSHAIVKSHGGTLTAESEVGQGSTFRLELPIAPLTPPAGSSS